MSVAGKIGQIVAYFVNDTTAIRAQVVGTLRDGTGRLAVLDGAGHVSIVEESTLLPVGHHTVGGTCILSHEQARSIKRQTDGLLQRPAVQAAIAAALEPHVVNRPVRITVAPTPLDPSPGAGYPQPNDIPVKTTIGFSSNLNGRMIQYLDYDHLRYDRAMESLKRRNPRWHEVFVQHHEHSKTLVEIARELGITDANAWKRHERAKRFLTERMVPREDQIAYE